MVIALFLLSLLLVFFSEEGFSTSSFPRWCSPSAAAALVGEFSECFNNTGDDDEEEDEDEEDEQISSTAYRFFVEEDATILERSIIIIILWSLFFSFYDIWGKKEQRVGVLVSRFGLSLLSRTSQALLPKSLTIPQTEQERKREKRGERRYGRNRQVKRLLEWALFFFTTLLQTNFYSCDDGERVKETQRSFERRRQTGGVFISEEEEMRCVVERDSPSAFFLR